MNSSDILALGPVILPAAAALDLMFLTALARDSRWAVSGTLSGAFAMLASVFGAAFVAPRQVQPLFVMDRLAIFFSGLMAIAGIIVALLLVGYSRWHPERRAESGILLLLALSGAAALAVSSHFVSFFLGLEVLSVSLYSLIAFNRDDTRGIEAGLKYLILASVSGAFLLFGMALVYAASGTMEFQAIAGMTETGSPALLVNAGLGLIVVGIGFKLGVVPFHMWTPDVYEGAPAPVAAFVAAVSKTAVVVLLLRYADVSGIAGNGPLFTAFSAIAAASMIIGNLLALFQKNIKRLLAYSSIAHLGYLLVAFLAAGEGGTAAVLLYSVAYTAATLGAFGVVTVLSGSARDADRLEDYEGLAYSRPVLASALTLMFLSLAGIPLTVGFTGKFAVLAAGAASGLWWLVLMLVAGSAIGLFYYLRVLSVVFAKEGVHDARPGRMKTPVSGRLALIFVSVVVLGLGIFPAPLIDMIWNALGRLR